MKGLIIKDFMCLRRQQSVMFFYIIVVTIILSVMFVLSSSHGNISHVMDGLMATCPFVKKIHNIVKEASDEGKQVIVIGNNQNCTNSSFLGVSCNFFIK